MSTRECADENALARIECEKLVNDPNVNDMSALRSLWKRWSRRRTMSKKRINTHSNLDF